MESISLGEYYDLLDAHDWYYQMSDDSNVYRRGTDARVKLAHLSDTSKQHTELFKSFKEYYAFNRAEDVEKPVKDPSW